MKKTLGWFMQNGQFNPTVMPCIAKCLYTTSRAHPRNTSFAATGTAMNDVMHKYITVGTEIMMAFRTAVAAERAHTVHSCTSPRKRDLLEVDRACVARRAGI